MSLIVVHDLKGVEIILNMDKVNAAIRKTPDKGAVVKDTYTKLFFVQRDMTMGAMGFPDTVQETPQEIYALVEKSKAQ